MNAFSAADRLPGWSGSSAEGLAESRQDLDGVTGIEEVDRREVVALDDRGFQLAHEARGRHREIVPHHDDGLQLPAVALAQGVDQLGLLLGPPRVQPLLELVHHDHDLATVRSSHRPAARA